MKRAFTRPRAFVAGRKKGGLLPLRTRFPSPWNLGPCEEWAGGQDGDATAFGQF